MSRRSANPRCSWRPDRPSELAICPFVALRVARRKSISALRRAISSLVPRFLDWVTVTQQMITPNRGCLTSESGSCALDLGLRPVAPPSLGPRKFGPDHEVTVAPQTFGCCELQGKRCGLADCRFRCQPLHQVAPQPSILPINQRPRQPGTPPRCGNGPKR